MRLPRATTAHIEQRRIRLAHFTRFQMNTTEGQWARWNHEYWPWYIIYLPVFPLLLWYAFRARSFVFFTNVDPAIDLSGFFGERKSEIYALLPKGSYPTTVLIAPRLPSGVVQKRMAEAGLIFPLIAKPDIGERGNGVTRVDSEQALTEVLRTEHSGMLLQALVPWPHEYGLLFARDPLSGKTELLSITAKRFLSVIGDGHRSVEELLARTHRGKKQLERLRAYKADLLARVPRVNEEVVVEPVGNHCRGTIFLDACHLNSTALQEQVSKVMDRTEGVYYGRFDVRAESEEALLEGRFIILEMNGVASEPGHIYDPSYSIFRCWSELLRHVRYIPRISAQMRIQGHDPAPLRTVIDRCRTHFGQGHDPVVSTNTQLRTSELRSSLVLPCEKAI